MNVLAFDTSGRALGVALVSGGRTVASLVLNAGYHHAERLVPAAVELASVGGIGTDSIDLIAVTMGPGSFTGLRVGVTTARVLSWAMKTAVVGVPTLDALAYGARLHRGAVAAALDARREAVFSAIYTWSTPPGPGDIAGCRMDAPQRVGLEEMVDRLRCAGAPVLVVGDAADRYRERLLELGLTGDEISREGDPHIRPESVAFLGLALFESRGPDRPADVVPDYLRPPGAKRGRRM